MTDGNKNNFAPVKREEVMDDKIQIVTPDLDKAKQLKETNETKDLLKASVVLYDYVLPHPKKNTSSSRLYDEAISKESITIYAKSFMINTIGYEELIANLICAGKSYAAAHNIQVR